MPRTHRVDVGGEIYHVINRANGRMQIFNTDKEYELFEALLVEAKELFDMRILAYTIMPNHWHILLYPKKDGDVSIFMHWLSTTHTRRVHVATSTVGAGHLYQGRYKSFLVDSDRYLIALIKYIERNAVRAKLAKLCEDWKWGSAWRRIHGNKEQKSLLSESPSPIPHEYQMWVNTSEKEDELISIRKSVNKGVPYGRELWVDKMVTKFSLEATCRSAGRPRKQ